MSVFSARRSARNSGAVSATAAVLDAVGQLWGATRRQHPCCSLISLPPTFRPPQVWAEELFKLAMNILAQNASRNTFLRKA